MELNAANPFLNLKYEPALENLGEDYYDRVPAAEFPQHILRFRNDKLLPQIGLDPEKVLDEDFTEAFGQFQAVRPFLALRYHGYQFGEYNPGLGDGRGFLYGQVRGIDGELYDLGTKGSGRTPYSRGGDGRLTLKGGVREVLAAEALHQMGVKTSRCLTMIETGESLWRGDEPSPTRSSVMVRFSRSHIRFGTFERFHYIGRNDLIKKLLDHVIDIYYAHLLTVENESERYALFYAELVQKVAQLVAQWMAAGFCHGVLNTDNMSITGESFDYGPYAFIPTYNPLFTAAYFDYYSRYCYGYQATICHWNLEMLQVPLRAIISKADMEAALDKFSEYYAEHYQQLMLRKLGLENLQMPEGEELFKSTIQVLADTQVSYHGFFSEITDLFSRNWREDVNSILSEPDFFPSLENREILENWRSLYHRVLQNLPQSEMAEVEARMRRWNPKTALLRSQIEAIWQPITKEDNWEPFNELIRKIQLGI
ncbi:protein adenylyltransferase SelO [Floridanema evergladense]|uniref:Protein nucleotidyltransferase YdiU n=1 Tax=Floridaenema evergladense BLCC-F167 TaxID=3153639 RepID=A0ABV4WG64_9CYAN